MREFGMMSAVDVWRCLEMSWCLAWLVVCLGGWVGGCLLACWLAGWLAGSLARSLARLEREKATKGFAALHRHHCRKPRSFAPSRIGKTDAAPIRMQNGCFHVGALEHREVSSPTGIPLPGTMQPMPLAWSTNGRRAWMW